MSRSRPRARAGSPSARPAPERSEPARALWIALAALLAIRLAAALPGSMAGWGFGLSRFAPAALGWGLWGLAAVALVPPLARPMAAALARVTEGRAPGARAALGLALATAALVWAMPDRLHFVGDFLLRLGTAERALKPAGLFPQALPLDVLLHYDLPRALAAVAGIDVATGARLLGVLEAAALAALAVAFVAALGLTGLPAAAATGVALCGGFLGVTTGYGKAISEMTVLTVATAVLGLRAARDPRWLASLGAVVAVGLTLHRSALALLLPAAVAWTLALRSAPGAWRRPAAWVGLLLPLAALALMLPRIVATMLRFDPVHFTAPEPGAGAWRALVSGIRLLDLVNLIAVVSPLALAIPAVAAALGRRALFGSTAALLGALALPWVAMTLLIHPPQGMFRDWDNYAAGGAALALIAAWLVGAAFTAAPSWRWLGLAALLGAAVPSVQWLALQSDVDRGLRRIEAFLMEPPARSAAERGRVWDFLGIRNAQLGRWDASAAALAHAAETEPSPRVLLQWALAEQARGDAATAREVFRRVTTVAPEDARAWYGLATESCRLGDYDECRRAALVVERLAPGSPEARELLEGLERVRGSDVPQAR